MGLDDHWEIDPDKEFPELSTSKLPEAEEKPEEKEKKADEWTPDKPFRDTTHSVSIWTNEEGHLQKVWVSPNWRKRLKGVPLSRAFLGTFMGVNIIRMTGAHPLPQPEPLPAEPYDGPLGWATFRQAQADHAAVDAKLAALDENLPPTRWVGEKTTGTDYDGAVQVTVGMFGNPVGLVLDEEWLNGPVRSSEIATGVMTAYRDAMRKHTPPHVEFGERELLAREHDRIARSLLATARNGIAP